jgi:hypothetical protein
MKLRISKRDNYNGEYSAAFDLLTEQLAKAGRFNLMMEIKC